MSTLYFYFFMEIPFTWADSVSATTLHEQENRHLLVLPYAGNKAEKIMKSMNKFSSQVLPCNVETCIAYSGTKLGSRFQLKDQTKKDHQHVVYHAKWRLVGKYHRHISVLINFSK